MTILPVSEIAPLSLSYLGPFQASLGQLPLSKFPTSKVQALLIYLTTEAALSKNAAPAKREILMELLWPGLPMKSSQVNLRQTLYRLRQTIPGVKAKESDLAVPLLESDRQSVQINPDADIQLDLASFCSIVTRNPIPELLVEAVALYRGDFLSDFYVQDSTAFEDWAASRRVEFRQQVLDALGDLCEHYIERGEYKQAVVYSRRQLELDDLREEAHQQLMFALVLDGQRNTALLEYQMYSQHLKDELGIEPSAKTTSLYEQIRANTLRESREKTTQITPIHQGMPIFLFTDIQGSTPLWERYRKSMLSALLKHNEILTEQINLHKGRILELRGDGVKAVFEGVDPLPCVLAIQKAFGKQDWGDVGDVRIRIGLHGTSQNHLGQEYFLKGDQYYGPALHHAARIMDAGYGGQILVSDEVRNAFPLPPGASWNDFGFHVLKGVEEPHQIFGLIHPDLPMNDFPPLRTLPSQEDEKQPKPDEPMVIPNNLRSQTTHFIGREEEIEELNQLVADPGIRLITIVGPGGIGKTRLVLSVAERQLNAVIPESNHKTQFTNGIFFVPLAALNSFDNIVPALGEALGFQIQRDEQDARVPKQQVLDYIREKKMMVILDNFEHLLEGAFLVSEILREAPGINILVTSRERLLLHEEQVYPIQGLKFPDWERPDDSAEYTAAQLFLQAARRVSPTFAISNNDLRYLVRICTMVDGTPLALELAASWVDMLTLEDIATEIQQNLDFLETEWRDMPERHRSMRATMDASWQRLSLAEKETFKRLSVFRGSFSREAARMVTQASLRTLADLVNKSLLQYDRNEDRYDLHELMRQFSAEKLISDAESFTDAMNRHSAYYCQLLEIVEAEVKGQWQWIIPIGIESLIENIRAAWMWAVESRNVDSLGQAAYGLYFFCEWHFSVNEGAALCSAAVQSLQTLLPGLESAKVLRAIARIEIIQAILNFYIDNREQAVALLDHSHTLLESNDLAHYDTRIERAFHLFLTGYLVNYHNPQVGIPLLKKSLDLYRELNETWDIANVLRALGQSSVHAGELSKAKDAYEESLELFQELGNQPGRLMVLIELGTLAREGGDFTKAGLYFEQAKIQAHGNKWGEGRAIQSLAWLALYQGRLEDAKSLILQAKAFFQEIGYWRGVGNCLAVGGMTAVYWLSGRFSEACEAINQSMAIYSEVEGVGPFSTGLAILAEINVCTGNLIEAREYANRALYMAKDSIDTRDLVARSNRALGWIAIAEMDYSEAQSKLIESINIFRAMKDQWGKEYLIFTLAPSIRAEIGVGKMKNAIILAIEALDIAVTIRAFLPLLFLMPVLSLLFATLKLCNRSIEILALAETRPFVRNSQLMQDVVCTPVRELTKNISSEVSLGAQTRGQKLDWWETAEALLGELRALQDKA